MNFTQKLPITLIIFAAVLFMVSCSKGDKIDLKTSELTEEEAVEIIEAAIQKSTAGLNDSVEKYSEDLTTSITLNEVCDSLYQKNYSSNYDETFVQAAYVVELSYQLSCNSVNVPESAAFTLMTDGSYTSQRIASDDASTLMGEMTGLQPIETDMVLNGSYSRSGTQELSAVSARSVSSTLIVDLTEVVINKESNSISAGTGTILLSGSSQQTDFSFPGSLVFSGNGEVILTINGTVYQFDIN